MPLRLKWACLCGLIILLAAPAAWGQDKSPEPALARPRLLVDGARLERLRVLAKGQSPQWRRLLSWSLEPGRNTPNPADGPGLAMAALMVKSYDAQQAATLGRKAVVCALTGAPGGLAQGVSRSFLADNKRLGASDRLYENGYVLINPNLSQERLWAVQRFAPNGVTVDANEPSLQDVVVNGGAYVILMADPLLAGPVVGQLALTLDWAWEWFTPAERQELAQWLTAQAWALKDKGQGCFDRQAMASLRLLGLAGLACQGLHPKAQDLAQLARQERFEKQVLPCLRNLGAGGAWFEGTAAGAMAGLDLLEYAAAVQSATGEDLMSGAPWFSDRLAYLVFSQLPGVAVSPRGGFRRYMPDGDRSLPEQHISDLQRLQMLLLASSRPQEPSSSWAWTLLLDRRAPRVLSDHYLAQEFLWLEPEAAVAPMSSVPLSHLASGAGKAFARSDWSELGTWLSFSCGPHFAAAQHLDAGALQLFRRTLLLGQGGAWDGAASQHAANFGLRTLAHSTVVVHDPQEYSWYDLREGAQKRGYYTNDGGQRAWALFDHGGQPTRSAPWTASGYQSGDAPWDKLRDIYEVASLEAVEDKPRFVYMRGSATRAYDGSTHKMGRFLRHVFHLRAGGTDDAEAVEVVAVVDDLELKRDDLKARFVLHLPAKPELPATVLGVAPGRARGEGFSLRVKVDSSRLDVVTLWPASGQLYLFGEHGQADSWVQDRNHPPRPPAQSQMPWRVEWESDAARGRQQTLVHAMLPADQSSPPPPRLSRLTAPDPQVAAFMIHDRRWPRVVATRLGHPDPQAGVSYSFSGAQSRHLVAGLAAGQEYQVQVKDGQVSLSPGSGMTSSQAGLLAFKVSLSGQAKKE